LNTENTQILFQTDPLNREESRRRAVYQLLSKEQNYSLCLQFGLSRFLVPLSERKDLLNASEHYTLFQNAEEVLCSAHGRPKTLNIVLLAIK
jgi:hypothetical protein